MVLNVFLVLNVYLRKLEVYQNLNHQEINYFFLKFLNYLKKNILNNKNINKLLIN